ncbi:A24 family peptidase [bacterium]|nr:A24 family peptidase [bacterium]
MNGVPEIALWTLLLVACATDLLWGKIFNWLTFPFLLLGLAFRFTAQGFPQGLDSLLAVGVAFAAFFPLFAVKAVAAGDVKLLMAIAAWTSAATVFRIAGVGIVFGAAVGLGILLWKKGLEGSASSVVENLKNGEPTRAAVKMPFGPALFCAYLVVSIAHHRHWEWM